MKIVFFGSSHFAVSALEALIKSPYKICSVVTQPDKKKGRHLHLAQTDIKPVANQAGLAVFQPEEINSSESIRYLKGLSADLFVVVAYGQILAQAVLDIPKVFAINIHASLLPKYRGAAPINWVIINGEKSTGVTIMKLIRKMDAGPVLRQKETPIAETEDSIMLESRLSKLGAELLIAALEEIKNKTYRLTEQNEEKATRAPKLEKGNGEIDWSKPAAQIHNLVRGCLPWPGAFTYYKDKLLKIYNTSVGEQVSGLAGFLPGQVLSIQKKGLAVMAGDSSLLIKELQLEGGNRMNAGDFIHGSKVKPGESLGS